MTQASSHASGQFLFGKYARRRRHWQRWAPHNRALTKQRPAPTKPLGETTHQIQNINKSGQPPPLPREAAAHCEGKGGAGRKERRARAAVISLECRVACGLRLGLWDTACGGFTRWSLGAPHLLVPNCPPLRPGAPKRGARNNIRGGRGARELRSRPEGGVGLLRQYRCGGATADAAASATTSPQTATPGCTAVRLGTATLKNAWCRPEHAPKPERLSHDKAVPPTAPRCTRQHRNPYWGAYCMRISRGPQRQHTKCPGMLILSAFCCSVWQ